MIKAAGACIIAKDTKRIILQQRDKFGSHPRNWGFWGGKVEDNENAFVLKDNYPVTAGHRLGGIEWDNAVHACTVNHCNIP